MRRAAWVLGLAGATLAGCGTGTGRVNVTIWGEEFIQDQIPTRSTGGPGFENGWSLRYTRFLVNAGNFTVASSTAGAGGALAGTRVWDLHALTGPVAVGTIPVLAAQRWNQVSYEIVPATAASTAGNATATDVQTMVTNGYSVYLEATASHAAMGTYALRWGFTNNTRYENCNDAAMQAGIVVPTGSAATPQITVHGDHLFYDDLQSPDALVRFDAIASADADGDRVVTLDELAGVDLTRLPTGQYGVGAAPNVRNLRDFVTSLVATIGHFSGEGHCEERRR